MKRITGSSGIALLLFFGFSMLCHAEKVKTIHFMQDNAQRYMVSKVYELKYTRSADLCPFVLGAVKRYNHDSSVERLNYKYGKKQILVVSTPREMMPFVDKMIADMDRPGTKDESGSTVHGTGIYRYAYKPRYRSSDEMVKILNSEVKSGDGQVWRNAASNIIYWKDSHSDGNAILIWAKGLDRPVPQVDFTVKVYEVRQSDLTDLGLDYVSWKNGPGLNMFSGGLDLMSLTASEQLFSEVLSKGLEVFAQNSTIWGGIFFAPQIDASFLRMLSQSGNANIVATGSLTVVNDYSRTFEAKFSPEYENIEKTDNDQSGIYTSDNNAFHFTVSKPTINFRQSGSMEMEYDGRRYDETTYSKMGGAVIFDYQATMKTVVERNNFGDELTENSDIRSSITLDLGIEKVLGVWKQENEVEQVTGVPFLIDIPVIKYLFGTSTKIKTTTYLYVTIKGELRHPDVEMNRWSGQLLDSMEFAGDKHTPQKVEKTAAR